MTDHLKGLILTTAGVLLVVPDSLFVRLIGEAPLVTSFWRSFTAGALVALVLLASQGTQGFRAAATAGWPAWLYVLLLAITSPGFVLAVENTSVANVVFIFATIPIFAAIFSRVFLGEKISKRMIWTMIVVFAGLAIIGWGSQSNDVAHWSGDLLALLVSISFAASLTAVRKVKEVSMVPAVAAAYLLAAAFLFPITNPLPIFAEKYLLFLAHGAFIAAATCLMTLGPRYLPSAEVSLLILLESVFAPLLVWVVIGENPGQLAIIGGGVVIGALVVSNIIALRRSRSQIG